MQLLVVRSQQLHHGTFCTASSPGTIHPAVHPSAPITFYIPDEIFDIFSLCLEANKTCDWEILVIGAVAMADTAGCSHIHAGDGENISWKLLLPASQAQPNREAAIPSQILLTW